MKYIPISIRLPEQLVQKIDADADAKLLRRTEIIKTILWQYYYKQIDIKIGE